MFLISGQIGALFYTLFLFPSSYLVNYAGLSQLDVSGYVMSALFFDIVCLSFIWRLIDKVGATRFLFWIIVSSILCAYPLFLFLYKGIYLTAVRIVSVVLLAGTVTPYCALLVKQFNTSNKYTSISLSYTLGTSLIGGLSPMLITWLIEITQSPLIPSIYLISTGVFALISHSVLVFRNLPGPYATK